MSKQGYVLPLHVEQLEDGRYLGRSPKLPGLNVQADSIEEVVRLAPKVARSLLAAMRASPRGPQRERWVEIGGGVVAPIGPRT